MNNFTYILSVILLYVFISVEGFRILKSGSLIPEGAYFKPLSKGNTSRYGDPTLYQRERINEGAFPSGDQELIYEGVSPRQSCPGMVGPFSDGKYYCSAREFGYCDRRSGTCFCNMGYSGNDCSDCSNSHYKIGYHCFPKKLCPNDCNGAGICNYNNGSCSCFPHREGSQCEILLCSTHSPLCEACTKETCLSCKAGYYLSFDAEVCRTCYDFDPRCAGCTKDLGCTTCADSTLTSVLRSGYRTSDPPLPIEENTREFSITLPFGTKSPESFADAENYFVCSTPDQPLKSQSITCDQGLNNDERWSCNPYPESHVVCGHFGIFSFVYPNYAVTEKTTDIRIYVRRSGGGYGNVKLNYFIKHFTTNDSDLIATAAYTTSQQLDFSAGVIERSFKITILDDNIVEENEVFQVVLEVPEGGGSVGAQFRTNITIIDDDLPLVNNKLSKVLENTTQAKAGELFTIFVEAVAATGIPLTMGGNTFYALIENDINIWSNPNTPTNSQRNSLRQLCTVVDFGNGTYAVTSSGIKEQGNYQLRVWVGFPNAIKGQYYYDAFFERLAVQRLDHMVNFTWGTGRLIPRGSDYISIRWSGLILSNSAGYYKFKVEADDNARLWIDGDLLLDHWHEQFASLEPSRQVYFAANTYHELVMEYREVRGEAHARLLWTMGSASMQVVPQANLVSLFEVDRSPVQVKILSTETSAPKSECTGDGLYKGVARHRSYFSVCPRDQFRNLRNDDNLFYLSSQLFFSTLTITNPNYHKGVGAETITPTLTYNFDTFCFDGYYTPELAGTYLLNIYYQPWRDDPGQHVAGSPFQVLVDPDKMSGPHSDVNGLKNPLYAEAGHCYDFTVVARDKSKNLLHYGGNSLMLYAYRVNQFYQTPATLPPNPGKPSVSPTTSPTGPLKDFGFEKNYISDVPDGIDIVRHGIVTDLKNGNYSLRICPVITGLYEIHILYGGTGVSNQHFKILNTAYSLTEPSGLGTHNGDFVANSPYAMVVTHTEASTITTTAFGPGLSTAITGIPTYFIVTVRDPWDNVLRDTTHPSVVTAKLDLSPNSYFYVSDYKNGSFHIQYIPELSGNNWLSVFINGYQIRASPFFVNVSSSFTGATGISGKASAQYSYVIGSGLHSGETGYSSYFLLYSFDIYGNKIGSYDDHFSFDVKGANFYYNSTVVPCPSPPIEDHPICDPHDDRGGIYFGTYIPLVAELVHVRVFLMNLETQTQTELSKSNFSALIIPSEPKAEYSDISGVLYDNIAGVTKNVNLQLRDYYQNKLDVGKDILELAFLGVSSNWGTEEPFHPSDGLPNEYYYTGFNKGNPTTYGLVTDNKDGSYTISYSSNVTGLYLMRLALAEHGLNATFFNDTSFGNLHDNNFNSPDFFKTRKGINSNLGNDISWTGDINGVPGTRGDLGRSSYIDKYLSVMQKNVQLNFTHSTPDNYLKTRINNMYKFRDEYWSARYTGMIIPPHAEVYSFSVDIDTESSVELRIGGVGNEFNGSAPGDLVIYFNSSHQIPYGTYNFSDNKYREFVLSYSHPTGDAVLVLYWESYSTPKSVVPYSAFYHWRNISQFNTTIHPAPLSSKDSTAYGDALHNAQVSVVKSFVVYARDQFGNLMQTGNHNPTMLAIGKNGVAFRGRVTDYGNSTYLIEYYPTTAGDYLMYVTIGCCPADSDVGYQAELQIGSQLFIKGSPFTLKVIPAEIDQTRTIAVGNGLTGGIVGEISSFTVIYRDVHNNPTTVNSSDDVNITVRFFEQKSNDLLIPSYSYFSFLPNNVTYYYNITNSGTYYMHVDISVPFITTQIVNNNILKTSAPHVSPIIASPFSVIMYPKIFPDPSKTECKGVGLRQASVNKTASFEVRLFDIYNNPLLVGGNKFYIRLIGDAKFDIVNLPVVPLCQDSQRGVYTCSYTPLYKGFHHIAISVLQRSGSGVGGSGLLGSYYTSLYGSLRNASTPEVIRVDPTVSMTWMDGYIIPMNSTANGGLRLREAGQSIRWDGYLISPRSDYFNISVKATSLNVSVYCDNMLIFDSLSNIEVPIPFVQNSVYQIRITATTTIQTNTITSIDLLWSTGIIKPYTIPTFFLYPDAQEINLSPFPVQVHG